MKSNLIYCLLAMLMISSLSSCLQDECEATQTYTRWDPVYRTLEDLAQEIKSEPARELLETGKIFYHNGYLLISEVTQGIHVIDNRDPANPVNISFINIPGNLDMAVKGNRLYADMYTELMTFDISDILDVKLIDQEHNVFRAYYYVDEELGLITGYEERDETLTIDCMDSRWGSPWFPFQRSIFAEASFTLDANFVYNSSSNSSSSAPNISVAGSLARFGIKGERLYALNQSKIESFALSPETDHLASVDTDWGIETVYPYKDHLFVGAEAGMYIYGLDDPDRPNLVGEFVHARACDPVFVTGDIAYVTLRDGNRCAGFINQLEVLDVSQYDNPTLIRSHSMHNPRGLSVLGDELFLCDGDEGVKVFDVSNPRASTLPLVNHWGDHMANDIIIIPPINLAMVVGEGGIRQYLIEEDNLRLISVIDVQG